MEYWVNALGVEAAQLEPIARAADRLGYAGLALADHSVMPERIESRYPGGDLPWAVDSDWPDVWVQIAALAAVTERLRFASNVYVLPARPPLVALRAIATAAVLSGGRVVLGVGVGWMAEEFAAQGAEFSSRGERTDEVLAILRQGLDSGVVEHRGRHYRIPRVHVRPAPQVRVPIWIGGESTAALRRVAGHGDGWISGRSAGEAAERLPELHAELRAAGREPGALEIAASAHAPPGDKELAAWTALGIGHLKVQPWRWYGGEPGSLPVKLAALERLARERLAA